MSTLEEERKRREEEIKRKLKSKIISPSLVAYGGRGAESGKAPEPEARLILRPKQPSINLVIGVEERPPLLKLPQPKPPIIKPRIPVPKESDETATKKVGISMPKMARILDEAKRKLELKILRAQLPSEALRLSGTPVPESEKEPEISLKPLRPAIKLKLVERRVSEIIKNVARKPAPLLTPRMLIESRKGEEGERVEESPKIAGSAEETEKEKGPILPGEIFIPSLLEELGSAASTVDRPICIVLPKREHYPFLENVAITCREIYRIVGKGKPEARSTTEGHKEGISEEIKRCLRAGEMVFIVDADKYELLSVLSKIRSREELYDHLEKEEYREKRMVLDRLRELFSQNFGFIIFHIKEEQADQLANSIEKIVKGYAKVVKLRVLDWPSHVRSLFAKVCWGFMEGEGETLDDMFKSCMDGFFNELEKVNSESDYLELILHINRDENAGLEHENMKVIVVECLARELGATNKHEVIEMLRNRKIETECEVNGGRADIYVPSQQRYVEIETFYGTGDPISKLKETLRKYEGCRGCRVDIVLLTGIQALLYARRLVKFAEIYHKEHGLRINFYLPNLKERRLIPLQEVFHMLKEAMAPLEPAILTEDDIERLWNEFSEKLREYGENPEKYRAVFEGMSNRYKSYEENRWILDEVEGLVKAKKSRQDAKGG
jgi:hypothetical protein